MRPSGTYEGAPWPDVGKTIELPDHVAESMLNAGHVEAVMRAEKVEAAIPSTDEVETATVQTAPAPKRARPRKG